MSSEYSGFIQSQVFFPSESAFVVNHSKLWCNVPLHRHDFVEMILITGGTGIQIINGISYPLLRGSFSVIFPWHSHELILEPNNALELFKCQFPVELLLDADSPFTTQHDLLQQSTHLSPTIMLDESTYDKVRILFDEIQEEYLDVKDWRSAIIKAKLTIAIVYFERCRRTSMVSDCMNSNIWRVIEYIHLSYSKEITMSLLSEKFHMNASRITKLIKENTGLNPMELLREVRIRNACALLAYGPISIEETAKIVGYQSLETFHRDFTRVKGTTPTNFRNSYVDWSLKSKIEMNFLPNAKIIYYLHQHYDQEITLNSIAQHFHYSESYLSEQLSKGGTTFTQLLHEIRVYHACTYLLTSKLPIIEIGFRVGFKSAETFYRVFKGQTGQSPSKYRKNKGIIE